MDKDSITIRDEISKCVMNHDYTQGPLLLLAGPGTGKTHSLLQTIKTQLQKEYQLTDFFEATLTNAAASDFLADARQEISENFECSSTLHYRAKGILHSHGNVIGLKPNFTVIDSSCEDIVVDDMRCLLGEPESIVRQKLSRYREQSAKCLPVESDFSRIYQKIQFFFAAIDWYDVVSLACRLLERHQQVREEECNRFKFLLIDEYQDLNPAEQKFVELLLDGRTNLLAVGDDDQSIYGLRHADPTGIVSFRDRFPKAVKMNLPITSRLPSRVIDASHELISRNMNREPKERLAPLTTRDQRANGGFVVSVNLKSGRAEQDFIAQALDLLIRAGVPPKQILVLCNCSALGLELVTAIEGTGIHLPIRNDLERSELLDQDTLLLRCVREFVSDQDDNLSLRIILDILLHDTPAAIAVLVKHSLRQNSSLWQSVASSELLSQLGTSSTTLSEFINAVKKASALPDPEQRLCCLLSEIPCLNHLLRLVHNGDEGTEGGEEKPQGVDEQDGIRFITLHSSKGLDADFVFIPFMEESIGIPAADTEEKRRLLYVGITRAKVGVVFSWAWSRRTGKRFKCKGGTGGDVLNRQPCCFIAECGVNPYLSSRAIGKSSEDIALEILQEYVDRLCLPREQSS